VSNEERARFIIQDVLTNHLPRLKESLDTGYVDENQALVIYDHLVRVRILREQNPPAQRPAQPT
jgi:hypothetical protein